MKNLFIIGLTAILAAVVSFTGCEPIENSSQIPQTNEAKIEAAKGELAIPAETDRDLDLPTVLNGVAISWASSDEAVISSAGHVTRQLYDTSATLTAKLALGGASDTKEFDVIVTAAENTSQTNEEKIEAAKNELAIPAETDRDLDLPAVLNGVAISWASSDESVISSAGRVTRGLYDAAVILTATLALGSASDTKEFDVTVTAAEIEVVVEEAAELVDVQWYLPPQTFPAPIGSPRYYVIDLIYSGENVIFDFTVDKGSVYVGMPTIGPEWCTLYKSMSVHSGTKETVSWHNGELDGNLINIDTAFIEILLRAEGNIIGYAVIEVLKKPEASSIPYGAIVLKSVLFPQLDGEYQRVSEGYVKTAIEKVKAEANTINALPLPIEEEAELVELSYWHLSSGVRNNRIAMIYTGENVVFDCSITNGYLISYIPLITKTDYDLKNALLYSGNVISWQPLSIGSYDFIEVIVKSEENIIGYAVIGVDFKNLSNYSANIFKSVLFPQLNGVYQNVNEKYLKKQTEKIKDVNK